MSNLSIFDFQSNNIRFETRNGRIWVCLTDMAKASGKKVNNWNQLDSTKAYIAYVESVATFPVTETIQGGDPKAQGTWAIEEVAIKFAAWCSVEFEYWVNQQIKTLLKKGFVSLKPKTALELAKEQVVLLEMLELKGQLLIDQEKVITKQAVQNFKLEEAKSKIEKEKNLLEEKVEKEAPLVELAKKIQFTEGCVDFNTYAKIIGTGRVRLFKKMREANVVLQNSNMPYQKYIEAGYFEASEKIVQGERPDGSCYDHIYPFALITGKGQIWLYQKLKALDDESVEDKLITDY